MHGSHHGAQKSTSVTLPVAIDAFPFAEAIASFGAIAPTFGSRDGPVVVVLVELGSFATVFVCVCVSPGQPTSTSVAIAATAATIGVLRFDTFVRHRTVNKVERKRETFSEKGLKAEEMELLGYDVVEISDFGLGSRDMWNAIDRVQEYQQRVKQAINRANKTELVALEE